MQKSEKVYFCTTDNCLHESHTHLQFTQANTYRNCKKDALSMLTEKKIKHENITNNKRNAGKFVKLKDYMYFWSPPNFIFGI